MTSSAKSGKQARNSCRRGGGGGGGGRGRRRRSRVEGKKGGGVVVVSFPPHSDAPIVVECSFSSSLFLSLLRDSNALSALSFSSHPYLVVRGSQRTAQGRGERRAELAHARDARGLGRCGEPGGRLRRRRVFGVVAVHRRLLLLLGSSLALAAWFLSGFAGSPVLEERARVEGATDEKKRKRSEEEGGRQGNCENEFSACRRSFSNDGNCHKTSSSNESSSASSCRRRRSAR